MPLRGLFVPTAGFFFLASYRPFQRLGQRARKIPQGFWKACKVCLGDFMTWLRLRLARRSALMRPVLRAFSFVMSGSRSIRDQFDDRCIWPSLDRWAAKHILSHPHTQTHRHTDTRRHRHKHPHLKVKPRKQAPASGGERLPHELRPQHVSASAGAKADDTSTPQACASL